LIIFARAGKKERGWGEGIFARLRLEIERFRFSLIKRKPKQKIFLPPPQTPTLKKKVMTESLESKTAFGFDFLKQKNSAKLVSG